MPTALLRPWSADDAVALLELCAGSPDLAPQLGGSTLATEQDAARYIRRSLPWDPASACVFAIEHDGAAVGAVGIGNIDLRHQTGWLFYWLGTGARGLHLASAAATTASNWALTELELFRLELGHRTNNPASCRVACKAGFLPEGIERAKLLYGTERFDVETHARLATDPAPATRRLELRTR